MNCQASAPQAHTGNPRWPSKAVAVIFMALLLSGCGFWPKKYETPQACYSECPDLVALRDETFGATAEKLKEIADQYYLCRKACQVAKEKNDR